MNIDYDLLGARIASFRKERRWTQEKLAEKTDLSNNYISNIENSYSIPSLETLMKICIALEITPNDLLMGSSTQEKSYLDSDVHRLWSECSPQEKRYIIKFIKLLISEREAQEVKEPMAV